MVVTGEYRRIPANGRCQSDRGGQDAQHFLNFFPLPHGHGSFRPTFDLGAGSEAEVPRSVAATPDSSRSDYHSPPKLIFVFCRNTVDRRDKLLRSSLRLSKSPNTPTSRS
jgi:hypothetical protein